MGLIVSLRFHQISTCFHSQTGACCLSIWTGESHLRTEASQWQLGPDLQAALEALGMPCDVAMWPCVFFFTFVDDRKQRHDVNDRSRF